MKERKENLMHNYIKFSRAGKNFGQHAFLISQQQFCSRVLCKNSGDRKNWTFCAKILLTGCLSQL